MVLSQVKRARESGFGNQKTIDEELSAYVDGDYFWWRNQVGRNERVPFNRGRKID